MTPRALATVLIRLFGVYLLATTLIALPSTVALRGFVSDQPGSESAVRVQIESLLLRSVVGLALVFASGPVVSLVVRGAEPPGDAAVHLDAFPLALSIVGVWLAATALPPLGAWLALFIHLSHSLGGTARDDYFRDHWTTIVQEGLQLAVGIFLFVGARGLASTWRRLRQARDEEPA